MPSCNSPRPATSMESFSSDSRTRSVMLPSASRSSRSRIMRPVTLSPSVPASGESLTRKVIAGFGFLDAGALEPTEGEQLGDAALLDELAVAVEHLHLLVRLHAPRGDAAGDDA